MFKFSSLFGSKENTKSKIIEVKECESDIFDSEINYIKILNASLSNQSNSLFFRQNSFLTDVLPISIDEWHKYSGDKINVGDKVCTILISHVFHFDVHSRTDGILECLVEAVGDDSFDDCDGELLDKYCVNFNKSFLKVHNLNSETNFERFSFIPKVKEDKFDSCINIAWENHFRGKNRKYHGIPDDFDFEKIYIGKEFLIINSCDFVLRFSFNFHRNKNYILFKYDKRQSIKDVSFLLVENRILNFRVSNDNTTINSDQDKISRIYISDNELNLFSNKSITAIRIQQKNKENIDNEINCKESVLLLKTFAKTYKQSVIENIKDYEVSNEEEIKEVVREVCYVYLMLDTTNVTYKIGISNSPEYREKTLQSEKPSIELLCSKSFINRKIALTMEKSLHENYDSKRIRGEWFKLTNEEVEEIIEMLS